MHTIKIELVTAEAVLELQHIGKQTFIETFADTNTAENMAQYVQEGFSTQQLLQELQTANTHFYFAKHNGKVLGYLKLNTGQAQTELQSKKALEIERIYILKAFQGQQIGQQLCNYAIEIAQANGAINVWLGVWEHNAKAIAFYKKNGFVAFDTHIFMLGTDAQTDILMKKTL